LLAFNLLVYAGVVILPRLCSKRHAWTPRPTAGYTHMHCRHVVEKRVDLDDEDADGRKWCNRKTTWRVKGSFVHNLPSTIKVVSLVKALYWFAHNTTMATIRRESKLTQKTLRNLIFTIRLMMKVDVEKKQAGAAKMGGAGKIVAIDETFFTKRKRNRAGFGGRVREGHKVVVLGMIELDMATRRATGNIRLIEIPAANKRSIFREIIAHVMPGSLIFTDKAKKQTK